MTLQEYSLVKPPKIDYRDAALAIGIRPDRVPPIEIKTEPDLEDLLAEIMGQGGGNIAAFDQRIGKVGTMVVDLRNFDSLAEKFRSQAKRWTIEEGIAKGVAPLEQVIAHELIHAKQLQDWLDAGHTDEEWTERIGRENQAAAGSYKAYRAIPEEADAFKRGPLYAHLVKITTA